jgi:hypothetical protein
MLTWRTGIAVLSGVVAVGLLRRLFKSEPNDPHRRAGTCSICGWSGTVSRYKPKCPMCNAPV